MKQEQQRRKQAKPPKPTKPPTPNTRLRDAKALNKQMAAYKASQLRAAYATQVRQPDLNEPIKALFKECLGLLEPEPKPKRHAVPQLEQDGLHLVEDSPPQTLEAAAAHDPKQPSESLLHAVEDKAHELS
jgi:hypothetical protein